MGCGNNLISWPFRLLHNRLIECFRSCSPAVTWGGLWPWLCFTFYPFLTLRFCIRQDMLEEGIVPRACPGEHTECQGKKWVASVWMGDPHHSSPVLRQLCGSSPFFLPFFTSISSMPCCCRLVVSVFTTRRREVTEIELQSTEYILYCTGK